MIILDIRPEGKEVTLHCDKFLDPPAYTHIRPLACGFVTLLCGKILLVSTLLSEASSS